MFGKITIVRDDFFCRRCHKGYGENDEMLNLNRTHRQTKAITEVIAYASQLVPSFQRASKVHFNFWRVYH